MQVPTSLARPARFKDGGSKAGGGTARRGEPLVVGPEQQPVDGQMACQGPGFGRFAVRPAGALGRSGKVEEVGAARRVCGRRPSPSGAEPAMPAGIAGPQTPPAVAALAAVIIRQRALGEVVRFVDVWCRGAGGVRRRDAAGVQF